MRLAAWICALGAVAVFAAGTLTNGPARPDLSGLAAAQLAYGPDLGAIGATVPPSPTPPAPAKAKSPAPTPRPTASAVPTKPRPSPAVLVQSTQQRLINQDRARFGLRLLTWSSCLYAVALAEARHLAQAGVAFQHYDGVSRDLTCRLGRQVGENIGWYSAGVSDTWMNSAFMASPDHKANILGPYHYVATAWAVRADGRAFIAVEFG
jgi:uncharacterized protein YkwD